MNSATLTPSQELKVMEKHSVTVSFNGGLYQSSAAFHSSGCSLTPRAIEGALEQRPTGLCADDTELNIFDAERYFREDNPPAAAKNTLVVNEVLERRDLSCDPRTSSVSSADGLRRNDRGGETPPTSSSEASWNSKSSLLSHRLAPPSSAGRTRSSGVRRFFRRSCLCSGNKSVNVEVRRSVELNAPLSVKKQSSRRGDVGLSSIPESSPGDEFKSELNAGEVTKLKISPGNWGKDRSFFNVASRFSPERTFPSEIGHRIVSSRKLFTDTAGFSFPVLSPPRDSLEVFRPSEEVARTMEKSSEFSPPVMALPRLGVRFSYPASPKQRAEEDAASDTSSDLFEIETSLSTTPTTNRPRDSLDELEGRRFIGNGEAAEILHRRRSLEGAAKPSVVPSECYPPSEASVEWSVVTAEGFAANFSSAASNYDEFRFIEEEHDRFAAAMSRERRKANGLLGCRCEKAVSVGPNPVRIPPPVEPDVLATNIGIAKFRSLGLTQERLGRPLNLMPNAGPERHSSSDKVPYNYKEADECATGMALQIQYHSGKVNSICPVDGALKQGEQTSSYSSLFISSSYSSKSSAIWIMSNIFLQDEGNNTSGCLNSEYWHKCYTDSCCP
ncbi:hypothetical protein ZIOFF_058080 [Zingiber officinale]|uniref:Uncharacterized protein n=1 Tax=Zingiber officinale TaxID=94328 RepID=A0A8J5FAJ0_ZINOF|nr:hypothetical protein ZIOFF_058080 [Zingiber officinale]